jgi:nickel transport protein
MRCSPLPLLCVAALALGPQAARAHAIETDLLAPAGAADHSHPHPHTTGTYQLHSAFSSGEPARNATVRLLASTGREPVELGRTDAQGRLTFVLPANAGPDAEIQVDAGAGHRDWIALSEINGSAPQALHRPSLVRTTLLAAAPLTALGLLGGLVAVVSQRRSRR